MTTTTDTRDEAYHDIQPTLPKSRDRVYQTLITHPKGLTFSEIGRTLKLPVNRITGRIMELRKAGLVVDGGRRVCGVTSHPCHIWIRNK